MGPESTGEATRAALPGDAPCSAHRPATPVPALELALHHTCRWPRLGQVSGVVVSGCSCVWMWSLCCGCVLWQQGGAVLACPCVPKGLELTDAVADVYRSDAGTSSAEQTLHGSLQELVV